MKRYGQLARNGQTELPLHKLVARKNVFENLMGTLLVAKQHEVNISAAISVVLFTLSLPDALCVVSVSDSSR